MYRFSINDSTEREGVRSFRVYLLPRQYDIRINGSFPGFILAESIAGKLDDSAAGFVFVPPLTCSHTLNIATAVPNTRRRGIIVTFVDSCVPN